MRVAFVNSGLGLLPAAAALRLLRPDADVVLSMDPDGMPWGPRTVDDITARTLACVEAALPYRPDALVIACNTASVHALDAVRAQLEPALPVIGTVPAVKPAASTGGRVAIWATVATTHSAYQRRLISEFAPGQDVEVIACPGLADAVHTGDRPGVDRAVRTAAAATSAAVTDIVLGCTEYELIPDVIAAARPRVTLHGTARAIAAQAVRRVPAATPPGTRDLVVLLSGRPGPLPPAATGYAATAALLADPATLPADPAADRAGDPAADPAGDRSRADAPH